MDQGSCFLPREWSWVISRSTLATGIWQEVSEHKTPGVLSLGVSETVKFVARHTKNYDLLRIFNLAIVLSHLGCEKAENRIF